MHVSSPSVAHAGRRSSASGAGPADPTRARGHYARSKALAEQVALAADGAGARRRRRAARTSSGAPATPQLVGRIVARARAGRLAVVGTGAALVDTTYVDNAVDALVAALDRAPEVTGRAFVVSNGEPRPVAELVASHLRRGGGRAAADRRAGPDRPGRGGRRRESRGGDDPPMTRFLAEQLSTAHWFDQRATRAALGWTPRVGLDEGFAPRCAPGRGRDGPRRARAWS